MIELKTLSFRNFLSYGNQFTEYNFKTGLTRISGKNGHGKSTINDALFFALFGKVYREINLMDIINSKNKSDLVVELEVFSDGNNYKIKRGLKPNIFDIEKNGELLNQDSSKKDYQKYLEDEILHVNEEIFHQIITKSLTRDGSFLTLPKGKKRQVIENIFGIGIISNMKTVNKTSMDSIVEQVSLLGLETTKLELLIEQERSNIERLELIKSSIKAENEKANIERQNKIEDKEKEIEKYETGLRIIKKYKTKKDELLSKINGLLADLDGKEREFTKCKNEQNKINEHLIFMESACPTCPNMKKIRDKEIDTSHISDKMKELEHNISFLKEQIDDLFKEEKKLNTVIDDENFIKRTIRTLKENIDELKKEMNITPQVNVTIDKTRLNAYLEDLHKINEDISNKNNDIRYHKLLNEILSDNGIRSFIVKKYLPILNKLLNTYLKRFSSEFELEFDNELDIQCLTKFKEGYKYNAFSEGQKRRINLSIMFTFLEFCKMKNSKANFNLIILDESGGGLDNEGENTMFEILRELSEKENKEVMIISHSDLIDPEKVDRLFEVTLNDFSKLELVQEI